jgi:hypothetical protein
MMRVRFQHMLPARIEIDDLEGAVAAEVAVEYWGGHIGTSEQALRVNGCPWIPLPQPVGTPTRPEAYYRNVLGNPPVPISLSDLRQGVNAIDFHAGPQVCYSFNLPHYTVYAFTVRIYYGPDKPHAEGYIAQPANEAVVSDYPEFTVALDPQPSHTIFGVDLIGCYDDFDWAGNGRFRQWHYQSRYGQWEKHIGTTYCRPYTVVWDTSWIPDQHEPVQVMARIRDISGMYYMSPVTSVMLKRARRMVRMFRSADVPENFCADRVNPAECTIDIDSLQGATAAKLVLSTWSAAHADEIGLNGQKLRQSIGRVHDCSYDSIALPLTMLRTGKNRFYIDSRTKGHKAEVNWPGPVILVEYSQA